MKSLVTFLALSVLLAHLAACGSKGPLLPPDQKPADTLKTPK